MLLWALILAYGGMAALCLAMNRHFRQVTDRLPGPRLRLGLRLIGWSLLALLFALSIETWGWSIGVVAGFGMLSAGGLLLIFLLPYVPRLAIVGGAVALIPAVTGTVIVLTG